MNSFAPELLECLAAIVEEGGFEKAAERLSITQSAVSQRLRVLETQVGAVLIVRGRPLKPTVAGRLLIKHAQQMRLLRADLERDLRELKPGSLGGTREDGRISIAVNADSIATWALPAFDALVRDGLPIEVIADDQDFTQEWLRQGEVLGCVTTLRQALRGCRMVALGDMAYVAVASPPVVAALGDEGLTAYNFQALPFIAFNRKDDLQVDFVKRCFHLRHAHLVHCFVPSSEGQVRAALAGWGASVVPELLVRPLIESGALINLAPQTELRVSLYWHCWNIDSALLAALTTAVSAAAAGALKQTG